MQLTSRNATISQKFMDKEECKNSSHKEECNNITKIHGQGGMQKFISQRGMQQYHKNSWTRRNAKIS
jgi:hypothetical protein